MSEFSILTSNKTLIFGHLRLSCGRFIYVNINRRLTITKITKVNNLNDFTPINILQM